MPTLLNIACVRSPALVKRLTICLAACFLVATVGCADSPAGGALSQFDGGAHGRDDGDDEDDTDSSDEDDEDDGSDYGDGDGDGDGDDSSSSDDDSDTDDTSGSGGSGQPSTASDAGAGGIDWGSLFPPSQPSQTSDAGTSSSGGARNVNGPCKDLQLLCFDPFDMFIINPSDCFTCNGGKGCQGCAFPFAY